MFVVPKPEGEKPENRFEFKVGNKKYSLPFIQYLSGEGSEFLAEQSARLSETVLMRRLTVIENPDVGEVIASLSNDQVQALSSAWATASTTTPGESTASED